MIFWLLWVIVAPEKIWYIGGGGIVLVAVDKVVK